MKQVLLDTDILSEFLRGNQRVAQAMDIYLAHYNYINFSIISYYEILNGLLYKDAHKQLERFEQFASYNKIIPLTLRSVRLSAEIQADLRSKGAAIGHTDTLIAGVAIAGDLQLITNNTDHFQRVAGLDVMNWMR